jgi:hypothetical protein
MGANTNFDDEKAKTKEGTAITTNNHHSDAIFS